MWSASFLLTYTMCRALALLRNWAHTGTEKNFDHDENWTHHLRAAAPTDHNIRREQVVGIEGVKFTAMYKYKDGLGFCKR